MPTLTEVHFGVVTDNTDPDKRGRVRAKSQSLTGADFELPDWLEPANQTFASKDGGGSLWIPKIGSTVELIVDVQDQELDQMKGERFLQNPSIKWRPSTFTDADGAQPLPEEFKTNYPARRGVITPGGHKMIFDDSGSIIIESKDGSRIEMKTNGSIVLSSPTLIGEGATELMILGNAFMTFFNSHVHGSGIGPTLPPTVAMTSALLSQEGNKVR